MISKINTYTINLSSSVVIIRLTWSPLSSLSTLSARSAIFASLEEGKGIVKVLIFLKKFHPKIWLVCNDYYSLAILR